MSLQNATEFVQRLAEDSDLSASVQNKEDAVRIASEFGTPFTAAELQQAIAEQYGTLNEDDLKNVAGGFAARLC